MDSRRNGVRSIASRYGLDGPGSNGIMSIASRYGLDGPGSNPGGNEIFLAVQTDPKAHPTSYTGGLVSS
jgi:hypothetical protein